MYLCSATRLILWNNQRLKKGNHKLLSGKSLGNLGLWRNFGISGAFGYSL
jgi:hypothetical protein